MKIRPGQTAERWFNNRYDVTIYRPIKQVLPGVPIAMMSIMEILYRDVPWVEKQKLKNHFFGEEYWGIEVFPMQSKLVDRADVYHIWIFTKETRLPFGIV